MKAIGLDIGTTSISGILLDIDSGLLLKSITKISNAFIDCKNDWEKIQDVNTIIKVAKDVLNALICDDISVIGVTGQMHGIVYTDKNGRAVSPLYTWQDGRGNLPYNKTTYADYLKSYTGYGCVTDFYNKVNGLIPHSAVAFCTIADYFVMEICGNVAPLIHPTNLASLGCYNLQDKTFCYDYNVNVSKDFAIAGEYKGIPVSVAIGDNQASVLSCCKKDDLLFNVGTGSQVSIITDRLCVANKFEIRPYFENNYLLVGCALCGGRAYSLMKNFLREVLETKTSVSDDEVYEIMARMLKTCEKPTVKADTRFAGTRVDKNITGGFYGITTENFKPSEFVSATLYGIVQELYDIYVLFGEKRKNVIGSGNGIRKNENLIRIANETFNCSLKITLHKEEASFGAALFGLIAIKKFESVAKAQQQIQYLN